jgi:hypothetical protein
LNGSVASQAVKAVRYSGLNRRTRIAWSSGSFADLASSQALNIAPSAASRCWPEVAAMLAWIRYTLPSEYSTDCSPSPLADW